VRELSAKQRVRRDLRRLFRCMDQLAKHPALARSAHSALSRMLGEVYQQFGLAWEFLGLQCRHWDGFHPPSSPWTGTGSTSASPSPLASISSSPDARCSTPTDCVLTRVDVTFSRSLIEVFCRAEKNDPIRSETGTVNAADTGHTVLSAVT
jgi:hypothetical protein